MSLLIVVLYKVREHACDFIVVSRSRCFSMEHSILNYLSMGREYTCNFRVVSRSIYISIEYSI